MSVPELGPANFQIVMENNLWYADFSTPNYFDFDSCSDFLYDELDNSTKTKEKMRSHTFLIQLRRKNLQNTIYLILRK